MSVITSDFSSMFDTRFSPAQNTTKITPAADLSAAELQALLSHVQETVITSAMDSNISSSRAHSLNQMTRNLKMV